MGERLVADLDKLAFVGGVKRGFVNLLENKEASIVRLEHPLPRVYVLNGRGHCFADLPDHNAVEHFLIFQHDQEFFAVDDEIMVGPCCREMNPRMSLAAGRCPGNQ